MKTPEIPGEKEIKKVGDLIDKTIAAPGRLAKSIKAVKEKWIATKDKNILKRLQLSFVAFWSEWKEVDDEEKKVEGEKSETSKKTAEAVKKNYGETMTEAKKAAAPIDKLPTAEKNAAEKVIQVGVRSFKDLDAAHQGDALNGLKKMKDGGASKFSFAETGATMGLSFVTMGRLKEMFPDSGKGRADLAKAIDGLKGKSGNSDLTKILGSKAFGAFKMIDLDKAGLGEKLSFASKAGKFLKPFGIDDVTELEKMSGLGSSPIKNKSEVVKMMKKYFFPNTSSSKVASAVKALNKMMTGGEKVSSKHLVELIFSIDKKDYQRLAQILTGKKFEPIVKIAA